MNRSEKVNKKVGNGILVWPEISQPRVCTWLLREMLSGLRVRNARIYGDMCPQRRRAKRAEAPRENCHERKPSRTDTTGLGYQDRCYISAVMRGKFVI